MDKPQAQKCALTDQQKADIRELVNVNRMKEMLMLLDRINTLTKG